MTTRFTALLPVLPKIHLTAWTKTMLPDRLLLFERQMTPQLPIIIIMRSIVIIWLKFFNLIKQKN